MSGMSLSMNSGMEMLEYILEKHGYSININYYPKMGWKPKPLMGILFPSPHEPRLSRSILFPGLVSSLSKLMDGSSLGDASLCYFSEMQVKDGNRKDREKRMIKVVSSSRGDWKHLGTSGSKETDRLFRSTYSYYTEIDPITSCHLGSMYPQLVL